MHRRHWPLLCLVLAAGPLTSAGAPPADISCKFTHAHYGSITTWKSSLTVGGPKDRTWAFRAEQEGFAPRAKPGAFEMRGTYELADGLAIFTGRAVGLDRAEGRPLEARFGLNYRRTGKYVLFDRFFPVSGEALCYRRRWYRKQGDTWRPAEERRLTLKGGAPKEGAGNWTVTLVGERTTWDEAGKARTERFERKLTYGKVDWRYVREDRGAPSWLPEELLPTIEGGKVTSVGLHHPFVEDVLGFHPRLAQLPRGPAKKP